MSRLHTMASEADPDGAHPSALAEKKTFESGGPANNVATCNHPPSISHMSHTQPHEVDGVEGDVFAYRCGVSVGLAHLLEHRQIEDP